MVRVVEYRRDLEPVRQFKDFFAIVEPIVVLNDKSILDFSGRRLEVLCKAIECCFFIPVDAADMRDDFVGGVSAERGQDFIVINQILDGARDNIFVWASSRRCIGPGGTIPASCLCGFWCRCLWKSSAWMSHQGAC